MATSKKPIEIKKSHRGRLTAKANKAGEGVQSFARKEAHNPNASAATRKQAQFAVNASKWNKK